MPKKSLASFLFCLCALTGCQKHYLSLRQIPIDFEYLASSHVGSPDPRQANPPYGQKIVMQWAVPLSLLEKRPQLVFHVVYKNHTEEELIYPIEYRSGIKIFSLLNEDFRSKGGILTYKAEIRTKDGEIYRKWQHQLWVELITLKAIGS